MSDLISRQVLDLWNRYKPTIAVDAIEYDRELRQLLGTNLASLGTDCISRQDALEAFGLSEKTRKYGGDHSGYDTMMMYEIQDTIENLPPIQPEIVRCKDCQYWNKGSCECPEHAVNCQDYYVGDIETKAEYFCGYAEKREVTT